MKRRVRVLAAGCFNRVHQAHLAMLRLARSYGDELVVVLAHDRHNRKPGAVPGRRRLAWLRSLGVADEVRLGAPHGFAQTVRDLRPDIIALGHDQRFPDQETAAVVEALGAAVVRLPWCVGREHTVLSAETPSYHG
ncbi:MAG: adenylyltransferase/cytidyltransferase family protein [Elusimicrobia bacterium]|nr:adenylyltransferase/cytidyltransferase family protein [Elusimicrobiota bacterium]